MRNQASTSEQERDQEFFDSVTEDEIMYHWRAIKSKSLSDDDAWQAIVTGIALDMGFGYGKGKASRQTEH